MPCVEVLTSLSYTQRSLFYELLLLESEINTQKCEIYMRVLTSLVRVIFMLLQQMAVNHPLKWLKKAFGQLFYVN